MEEIREEMTEELYDDELVLTLEMEDGETEDCIVLAIFPVDEKQYIALIPVDQAEEEEADIYLYEYSEDDDGQPILGDIEDDDVFEAVCDRFDEICDEEDFDELVPTTE
ncbi:MAG: DUF1292 domain-containing protein [Lachnospiraceae bacterium]|nr:DUF1292 domain-containing protein [Lachnospiraceae bacterium]